MFEIPNYHERAYLNAFGAAAVYAVPARIVAARDPVRVLSHRWVDVSCMLWARSKPEADYVAARAQAEPAATPERSIRQAAEGGRVVLTEHETAIRRARDSVARLDAAIAEAQREGRLRFFNSAYALYRYQCDQSNEPAMSYAFARARLRRIMFVVVARGMVNYDFQSPRLVERVLKKKIEGIQKAAKNSRV